ncbi:DnaJ domain-containing protein [Cryobacterium sp. PAMC25264]|uniref:DnaJ domain-containing protein n=1 Tax=Cryobacterium sp. PAMC25264 TaxID=2861288 RepID=UPI001C634A28|nr:DnaJ domain-containing protein [Cryobacterium sp. PAMC25264]QYF74892.1 DnaJ domain-containing protein [Cryobacterium sp. PAMC25264]
MSESPAAASPYEVLGVTPSATDEELRRAYRRKLRQSHPDVGGSAASFHAVQLAWERIGSPASRAAYDGARYPGATDAGGSGRAAGPATARSASSGVKARMYGHPGGHSRQRYLSLLREWAGRGTTIDDPYASDLIRSAPREIRHRLAKALAEESTAQLIAGLGIGYTAWHDVATRDDVEKIDHVVLGPAGLFAILSEDWGAPVQLRRGELVGDALEPGEEPLADFAAAARILAKSLRVRFTALIVVAPDEAVTEPFSLPSRGRRAMIVVIPRSRLVGVLRDGIAGMDRGSFEKVFELRSTLQNGIRFVED